MPRLLSRINFPKVVTVLAVTFGIALGACGATAVLMGSNEFFVVLGMIELAVMVLSAAGLVLVGIVWAVVAAIGDRAAPATTNLFDDTERRD